LNVPAIAFSLVAASFTAVVAVGLLAVVALVIVVVNFRARHERHNFEDPAAQDRDAREHHH
jgi:hypothetical protein